MQQVLFIGREFNQESVLFVDTNRQSELVYLNPDNGVLKPGVQLGTFQNVSEFEAKASDAYTFDPTTNYYYLAK
jgi:hypothetical protein